MQFRIKLLSGFLAIAAMFSTARESNAAFVINIGGMERSASGSGTLIDNAVTLTFRQFDANNVDLTVRSNLTDTTKTFNIMFNTDKAITSFTWLAGQEADASYSVNKYKQNGNFGDFDARLNFQAIKPSKALIDGAYSTYRLAGIGLIAESTFNLFASNPLSYTLASAHIGSLGLGDRSGKYGSTWSDSFDDGTNPVPEPASIALWLTVAVGGAFYRRRRTAVC